MIKQILHSVILMAVATSATAQLYPGSTPIPDELKKNAHSVIREQSIEFEVKSAGKAYYKVHEVVSVLDELGKRQLAFVNQTDKFNSLEDVSIQVFDADGNTIKKYSRKDLASINAGEGLVTDSKFYYLTVPANAYPLTIQTDYEEKYTGILDYPDYYFVEPYQSLQKSSYTVIVPAELDLRYKEKNISNSPAIKTEGSKKIYTWSVQNMAALPYEEGSVSSESMFPRIIISPNRFEMDGYEGDMTSWEKFGQWYASLAKQSIDLTPERKQFFNTLVKDAPNDREKVARIYHYLQQNFRYVLITLGIGGLKPFQASSTDKTKYGDCKGLSTYMQACLDAVGIKSYQALINAQYNKEPVDPDFSHYEFNHMILCVPLQKDSVWLECTSNTNDFGVLGSFTENRNALLITETGGKLVATPRSVAANNRFGTNCYVTLNDDGSGSARVNMITLGEYKQHYIAAEKKDEQKKYIVNGLRFIQPDEFSLLEKEKNGNELQLEMLFEKIPSFTAGTKMFLNPRLYKVWGYTMPDAGRRTQDFYFSHPFIKEDTTIYHLPQGYTVEALPEPKKLSFDYGSFKTLYSYDKDKNEVIVLSYLELKNHHIKAAEYAKAKEFFDAVLAEYNGKIVVTKSN